MPVMAPPRNATFSAALMPLRGGLRGAHVGAHRDVHADVARRAGENGADGEAAGGGPAEGQAERDEEHDADDGDGGVLAVEVGAGARLDRRGDLLHAGVAGRLRQDPAHRDGAVEDREESSAMARTGRYRASFRVSTSYVIEKYKVIRVGGRELYHKAVW